MNTIDNFAAYASPNTLDGLNVIETAINTADDQSLHLDGSNAMQASLNVASHTIINVANAINPSDGATLSDITSRIGAYLPTSGGTMSGNIDLGNNWIIGSNMATPPSPDALISLAYSQAEINAAIAGINSYLRLDGTTTMAGAIKMGSNKITGVANGTVATDAAAFGQISSAVASYLPLAGGTMSGAIAMGASKITGIANGTAATDAAAFGQIATALSPYLLKSGGTMTGAIAMGASKITGIANGTAATDVAAFGQIATALSPYLLKSGGTMTGAIAMGASKITGIANGTVATDAAAFGQISSAIGSYLPLAGGTLTGDVFSPSNRIDSYSASTTNAACINGQITNGTVGTMAMSTTLGNGKITNLQNGSASNDAVNYAQLRAPPPRTAWNSGDVVRTIVYSYTGTAPNVLNNTSFPAGVSGNPFFPSTVIHSFTYTPLQSSNYVIKVTYDIPYSFGGTASGADTWFTTMFCGAIFMASKTMKTNSSNANRSQPLMPMTGAFRYNSSMSLPLTFGVYIDTSGSNEPVTMGNDQSVDWFTMELTEICV